MLPDCKTYKATVIKTMWCWLEDIQINGIEQGAQKYTHINSQLIFDKRRKRQ